MLSPIKRHQIYERDAQLGIGELNQAWRPQPDIQMEIYCTREVKLQNSEFWNYG